MIPGSRLPGATPALALGLVFAGLALGIGLVVQPGAVIPLTIEAATLFVLSAFVLKLESNEETRRWVWGLFAAAVSLRFGALLLVHFWLSPYFFAPDAWGYEQTGVLLSNYWSGRGVFPAALSGHWQVAYAYINGFFVFTLGEASIGAAVMNTFVGSWTAVVTFYLAREVMGVLAGRVAGVLTAIFPSLVLWSVLNIRDALATFLVVLTTWLAVRIYRSPRLREIVLLVFLLVAMSSLRDYMALLVFVGTLVGWALALRPGRFASTLAVGTGVAILAAFGADQLGLFSTVPLDNPVESMAGMREALQQGATSAYGQEYETETFAGALVFLPIGLSYLLLAPFPWRVETALQATAVPEAFLWYLLLPITAWGIGYAVRRGNSPALVALGIAAVVVTCYALVEGNFGTAFRHRAQIVPVLFVFTATGLVLLRQRWEARRRSSRQRWQSLAVRPVLPRSPRPPVDSAIGDSRGVS
jgi:hypothetical protein